MTMQAAAGGQRVQVGGEVGRADQLEDHIEGAVVEDLAGSATTAAPRAATAWWWPGLQTPATTRGPGGGGELDGGRADPAGGPVHQQPVAQPEATG